MRADDAAHDRHRVRVAAEAGEEAASSARGPSCGRSRDGRNRPSAPASAVRRRAAGSRSRGSRRARRAARSGSRGRAGRPRRRRYR